MKRLQEQELKQIKGGISPLALLGIAAIVAFLAGVLDGYVHPRRCEVIKTE